MEILKEIERKKKVKIYCKSICKSNILVALFAPEIEIAFEL